MTLLAYVRQAPDDCPWPAGTWTTLAADLALQAEPAETVIVDAAIGDAAGIYAGFAAQFPEPHGQQQIGLLARANGYAVEIHAAAIYTDVAVAAAAARAAGRRGVMVTAQVRQRVLAGDCGDDFRVLAGEGWLASAPDWRHQSRLYVLVYAVGWQAAESRRRVLQQQRRGASLLVCDVRAVANTLAELVSKAAPRIQLPGESSRWAAATSLRHALFAFGAVYGPNAHQRVPAFREFLTNWKAAPPAVRAAYAWHFTKAFVAWLDREAAKRSPPKRRMGKLTPLKAAAAWAMLK